jgi:predicted anti-sigma-YlaC factor YlaD
MKSRLEKFCSRRRKEAVHLLTSVATRRSVCLLAVVATGCSVQRFAVNRLGDALAGTGGTFAADNDPELVREAVPFSLKLMESLLAESPDHRGLLLASCRSFTQYGYAFVQQDADELEVTDLARSQELKLRARNLYLRARDYGLRGLETRYRNFTKDLRRDPVGTVKRVTRQDDVPLLYWTAASWGAAISLAKNNPDLVADLNLVEALIDRAAALDADYDCGAIHGFLINYELARPGAARGADERAKRHFDRVVELTGGQSAGPFVTYAEAVTVARQNRAEFESLLNRALAVNVEARPEWRLQNMVLQRRARWLLSRKDELFSE